MIEIVILTYNNWLLTHQLLLDLNSHRENFHRVTVVNNGSEEKEVAYGIDFWRRMNLFKVTELRLTENRGFVGGANAGLRNASCDIVILLSNDVRIGRKKWVQNVEKVVTSAGNHDVLVGAEYHNLDTGWNCFNGRIFPYLSGHALAATNSAWEKLGYFDERYYPYDYEDIDLSTTAIEMGFVLATVPGISHSGGGTIGYNAARERQTRINRSKFEDKWIKK